MTVRRELSQTPSAIRAREREEYEMMANEERAAKKAVRDMLEIKEPRA